MATNVTKPEDRPMVASRLASIISSQRRGRARPDPAHRSGRIDRRTLYRAATGDGRIFNRPGAPSPTNLRVVVILDLSGSMRGMEIDRASQMAWDLILASQRVPTVSIEVWGHTTNYYYSPSEIPAGLTGAPAESLYGYISVYELYQPGMTLDAFHRAIQNVDFSGNEDGFAFKTVADDVFKRRKPSERVLFVIVSDGAPYYRVDAEENQKYSHVRAVVNDMRRKGAAVISVSVSASLRAKVQAAMYGHESVIQYNNEPAILTRDIARVIGRALD